MNVWPISLANIPCCGIVTLKFPNNFMYNPFRWPETCICRDGNTMIAFNIFAIELSFKDQINSIGASPAVYCSTSSSK